MNAVLDAPELMQRDELRDLAASGRIEADGRNDPLEEALLAFLAEG